MSEVSNHDLIKQIRAEHSPKPETKLRNKNLALLGIVVLLIAVAYLANNSYSTSGSGNEIVSANRIHWHAHLVIEDNGRQIAIPAGVGLLQADSHPEILHTHSDDGIIHMEIPGPVRARQIMIQRFLDNWSSSPNGMGYKLDWSHARMVVNGHESLEQGNLVMHDHDEIQIFVTK